MLAKEQPDLLSVATSDHRHAQIVVDAVEAGVRGIFCEKPIATTLADADRMIEACRSRGVPLLIDHSMRWYPQYVEARHLLRSGAVGTVRRVLVTGCGTRAMLFRNTTHVVDLLCFLVDSDPRWLVAELDDRWADYPPRYAGDGGKDPATDPGVSAYVHFENGVRAFLNCSQVPVSYREWDVIGDAGRLRIGSQASELWRLQPDGTLAMTPLRPAATTRADMGAAVAELIDLIEGGGDGSSTGEDGRRTLSVLLGILQSGPPAAPGSPSPSRISEFALDVAGQVVDVPLRQQRDVASARALFEQAIARRVCADWRRHLVVVQPETVLGWHRRGWRLFWWWRSRRPTGRPRPTQDVRQLIRRLSEEYRL